MFEFLRKEENKKAATNGIKAAVVFFIVYNAVTFMIWYPFRDFQPTFNPYTAYSTTPLYLVVYWAFPLVTLLFIGASLSIVFVFLSKKLKPLSAVVAVFLPTSLYILFTNINTNKSAIGSFNVLYDLSSWLMFIYIIAYFHEREKSIFGIEQ